MGRPQGSRCPIFLDPGVFDIKVEQGQSPIEKPVANEAYDVKSSTFVRRIFGSLKGAFEVKGRIIYQLNLDVGGLVVLAI